MSNPHNPPVVMTVAGLDPTGGAGVLADIKTISAMGCYGVAVVTSLTFQSTRAVFGARHQTAETVRLQMSPLFDDFEIAAIKTGMLPTAEIVHEVAGIIKSRAVPVVVVDPVMKSTSGFDLISARAADALVSDLFPLASLVTPNVAEAGQITGIEIASIQDARTSSVGEAILRMGARAVLITGGDSDSNSSSDLLLDEQGDAVFSAPRINSKHTHGTGCTLASALASLLARGHSLRDSVPIAKQYISAAILGAPRIGEGKGPINHSPAGFVNDF